MAETAAPPAPAVAKPPRKLALRLDNGTVIRATDSTKPTVLKPKDAWEAGMLDESHLLKMQALLCELHAKLPDEGPLKSISIGSKRSMDSVLEVNQAISTKRSHSVGDTQAAAAGVTAPTFGEGEDANDWVESCKKLIAFLLSPRVLDKDAPIFRAKPSVEVLPNYPKVIHEPMWFDRILEKLNTGGYGGPGDVYNDVMLLCDNCYKFNVEAFPSEFGFIGVKLENTFLAAWSKTPFAVDTPARPLRPPPPKLSRHPPKKPARSNGGVPRGGGFGSGRGRGRPGRPPGVARTKSVNSYGAYGAPAPVFTNEMQNALIAALHDPTVLEANMQGVVDILNEAGEMGQDEDGEATLDLEKVTPPTAAKLYELVVAKTGRAPVPGAVGATAPGKYVQMERDSDDDWDMEDE